MLYFSMLIIFAQNFIMEHFDKSTDPFCELESVPKQLLQRSLVCRFQEKSWEDLFNSFMKIWSLLLCSEKLLAPAIRDSSGNVTLNCVLSIFNKSSVQKLGLVQMCVSEAKDILTILLLFFQNYVIFASFVQTFLKQF